jgi:hypothetical protein
MKAPRRHRLADNERDANEAALVKLAEQLGGHWLEGAPFDGWIGARGVWLGPVEIKLPEREGTKQEFTPLQQRFITFCKLNNMPFHVWRNDADVLRTMGARVGA